MFYVFGYGSVGETKLIRRSSTLMWQYNFNFDQTIQTRAIFTSQPSCSRTLPPPNGGRVWLHVGYFLNTVFTVRKVLREYELNLSQQAVLCGRKCFMFMQHCYVVQFSLQGYCKFPAREMTPLFPDNERESKI